MLNFPRAPKSCRDISNKTRIETFCNNFPCVGVISVAEIFPIKQGLKPFINFLNFTFKDVAEIFPIKQGLKHIICNYLNFFKFVAEIFPIKQGLKPM